MDLYQQNILDYYKHPHCRGKLAHTTHHGEVSNPLCGDRLELYLKVESGKVAEAYWEGEGCVLSLAAADMLVEHLHDKTLKQVELVSQDWLLQALGINPSPSRLKCALLSLDALKKIFKP